VELQRSGLYCEEALEQWLQSVQHHVLSSSKTNQVLSLLSMQGTKQQLDSSWIRFERPISQLRAQCQQLTPC
jgi:hypothetical protein